MSLPRACPRMTKIKPSSPMPTEWARTLSYASLSDRCYTVESETAICLCKLVCRETF